MRRFQLAAIVAFWQSRRLHMANEAGGNAAVEEELKSWITNGSIRRKIFDVDYCEKFFADSYVLVFPNGQAYTKAQWLGILKGPDHPTINDAGPRDIKVQCFSGKRRHSHRPHDPQRHDSKGNSMDGEFKRFSRCHQAEWKLARYRRGDERDLQRKNKLWNDRHESPARIRYPGTASLESRGQMKFVYGLPTTFLIIARLRR